MHTELLMNLEQFEEKFRTFLSDPSMFKNTSSLTEMLDEKDRISSELFETYHLAKSSEEIKSLKKIWHSKQELDGLVNACIISKISETVGENERLKKRHMIPTKDTSESIGLAGTLREFIVDSESIIQSMKGKAGKEDIKLLNKYREMMNEHLLDLQGTRRKVPGLIDEHLREEVQFLTIEAERANSLAMSQESIIMRNNKEMRSLNSQLDHQTHLANTYAKQLENLESVYKESAHELFSLNEQQLKKFNKEIDKRFSLLKNQIGGINQVITKVCYNYTRINGDYECLKLLLDCKEKDIEILHKRKQSVPDNLRITELNEKLKKTVVQKDSLIKEQESIILSLEKQIEKYSFDKKLHSEEKNRLHKEISNLKNTFGREKEDNLQFKIDTNKAISKKDLLIRELQLKLSSIDQKYNKEMFSQYAEIESLRSEKDRIQSKLNEYSDSHQRNEQEFAEKDLEIKRLTLEIDESKQKFTLLQAEKNRFERNLEDLNLNIQDYQTKIQDLSGIIQELKREVQIRENSCKNIQESYDQAIVLNDNTAKTLNEAQEQLSAIRNSYSEKEKLIDSLNFELETARAQIENIQKQNDSKMNDIQIYKKDLEVLRSENESVHSKYTEIANHNKQLVEQIQGLNKENQEQKEVIGEYKAEIDSVHEEKNNYDQIANHNKQLVEQIQGLNKENQELKEAIGEYKAEIYSVHEEKNNYDKIANHNKQLAEQIQSLNQENQESKEVIGKYKAEIDLMYEEKSNYDQIANHNKQLVEQIQSLNQENQELKEVIGKYKAEIDLMYEEKKKYIEKANENEHLLEQIQVSNKENRDLKEMIEKYKLELDLVYEEKNKYAEISNENEHLLEQVQVSNKENRDLKEAIDKYKAELNLIYEENNKSIRNLEVLVKEKGEISFEKDKILQENSELLSELSGKNEELEELRQKIEENTEAVQEETKSLRNSIDSLSSEKKELLSAKKLLLEHIERLKKEHQQEIDEKKQPKDYVRSSRSFMSKQDLHDIIDAFEHEMCEILEEENTQDPGWLFTAVQEVKANYHKMNKDLKRCTSQFKSIANCLSLPEYNHKVVIEYLDDIAKFYSQNPVIEFADHMNVWSMQLAQIVNQKSDRIRHRIIAIEKKMNRAITDLDIKQGLLSQVKQLLGVTDDANILSKIRELKPSVTKIPRPSI